MFVAASHLLQLPCARTLRLRTRLHLGQRGRRVSCRLSRRVLRGLQPLDQRLLLGFHEGFCCAELASRFGRTEDCVKTRIHRARQRVRTVFEELVRTSGNLEEPELEEER